MVHWTLAGCSPPEIAKERLTLVLPPGAALPEPNESVACWARAEHWMKNIPKAKCFNSLSS
jgi:hypothetical protein